MVVLCFFTVLPACVKTCFSTSAGCFLMLFNHCFCFFQTVNLAARKEPSCVSKPRAADSTQVPKTRWEAHAPVCCSDAFLFLLADVEKFTFADLSLGKERVTGHTHKDSCIFFSIF